VTAVLRFDHVWKGYRDLRRGGPRTLRGTLVGGGLRERRPALRWALRDVSLELHAGETLGVVGRNGAGKSTLLRLASQLGRPTRGLVDVHPDSASVLNLGASFDLQLTGRENAYTAALVGGATSGESRRLVPEALRFAELEDFADAPVRTYSEGMKLRLAFGVIASRRPQLLILDEVLAVGDIGFREKCEARIAEMRDAGTSLVLASHSADEVAATCRRALWLHKGDVLALGDAAETVERYEDAARATTLSRTPADVGDGRIGSQELAVTAVAVNGHPAGTAGTSVRSGDALDVTVEVRGAGAPVDDPIVALTVRRADDGVVALDLSSEAAGIRLGPGVRHATVRLRVDRLELAAGRYEVDIGVFEADWEYAYDFRWGMLPLTVTGRVAGKGVLSPPVRWTVERPR
jgi:lipopolysaccharide transport system ATP-binding protein